jgi:glucose-6-phosphate isomerase
MALLQSIDDAGAERIGRDGVVADAYADVLARSADALAWLRARHGDGALPLLRLPEKADDLPAIKNAATRLSAGATDIVFLGTGGSSLGGQTVAQLAGCGVPGLGAWRDGPRLHFMDNLDPDTYASLLARLPLAATRFVAISKSGGTGETLMQTVAALAAVAPPAFPHRRPKSSSASPSPRSRAGATACAIFSPATASPCSITPPTWAAASRC